MSHKVNIYSNLLNFNKTWRSSVKNTNDNKKLSHCLNSSGSSITGRVVLIIVVAVTTVGATSNSSQSTKWTSQCKHTV